MSAVRTSEKYLVTLIKLVNKAFRKMPVLFAAAFVCVGSFIGFVQLASEILEGEGRAIDTQIMLLMRDPGDSANPLGPIWFEEMMRDVTSLGSVGVLTFISVTCAIFLLLVNKKKLMLYFVASVITGTMLSTVLKVGFDRPRPNLFPHGTLVYSGSFPSGHTLLATIVYLTLGALLAEIQQSRGLRIYILLLATTITLLVGMSRIYLGVHWPSDVLAGWLGGATWAFMFWIIAHHRKGQEAIK